MMRLQPELDAVEKGTAPIPTMTAAQLARNSLGQQAPLGREPVEPRETKGGNGKLVIPSDESVARFVGVSLGGALLGGSLFVSAPMIGALLGALAGVGVIAVRTWHAH
jgi:hypothetical protein